MYERVTRIFIGLIALGSLLAPMMTSAADDPGSFYSPTRFSVELRQGERFDSTISWKNNTSAVSDISLSIGGLSQSGQGYLVVTPPSDQTSWTESVLSFAQPSYQAPTGTKTPISFSLQVPDELAPRDYIATVLFSVKNTTMPDHQVAVPIVLRVIAKDAPVIASTEGTSFFAGDMSLPLPTSTELTPTIADVPDSTKQTAEATTGHFSVSNLTAPALTLFRPTQRVTLRNPSQRIIDAQVTVRYLNTNGQELNSRTLHDPFLLPLSDHTVRVEAPDLFLDTPLGKLPFMGTLRSQAGAIGESTNIFEVQTFVLPWWLAVMLLVGMVGFFHRILHLYELRPRPHRVLRYQGRTSIAITTLALLYLYLVPTLFTTWPATAENFSFGNSSHSIHVAAVSGYFIEEVDGLLNLKIQANHSIQINTPTQIYVWGIGDPPLQLPVGTPILIISPFQLPDNAG